MRAIGHRKCTCGHAFVSVYRVYAPHTKWARFNKRPSARYTRLSSGFCGVEHSRSPCANVNASRRPEPLCCRSRCHRRRRRRGSHRLQHGQSTNAVSRCFFVFSHTNVRTLTRMIRYIIQSLCLCMLSAFRSVSHAATCTAYRITVERLFVFHRS